MQGIFIHYLISLPVSSTSESKARCQVMYSDDLGTFRFPRKMNFGAWEWFLINAPTAKMMVKGSAAYWGFLQRKVQWMTCVRRNRPTKDSPCTLRVTTQDALTQGTPNDHWLLLKAQSLWTWQLGTNVSVLMKWKPKSVIQKVCWNLTWAMRWDFWCQRKKSQALFF